MKTITFIDTEVSYQTKKILDFGAINYNDESFHETSFSSFMKFIKKTEFICGHNIINHDLKYINQLVGNNNLLENAIDTLFWSPLLFPQHPYHNLVKDDKLITEELNNPLNDAKKVKELFYDEVEVFKKLPLQLKQIYYMLLKDNKEFSAFFRFLDFKTDKFLVEKEIKSFFHNKICNNANLTSIIDTHPVELAYCLALIYIDDYYSITPRWILRQYPYVDTIFHLLRAKPCITGCSYCNDKLDIYKGLKRFFGYDSYRKFDGIPLQEMAVQAAVNDKSLLAIFPTGGGKSLTFQVPALMAGRNTKGLTVVISPLQSLMKDQVDNLENFNISEAVTINGLLDPIERAESIKRVEEGKAYLLYISPESLRSKTIERLLLGRKISRFVIDEAHCFSSWGQDFRVDYLYIADFIKKISSQKNLDSPIPVSCFTATAKQNVIDDIIKYFKDNLNLDLELFTASYKRKNLLYKVIKKSQDEKYETIRDLLEYKKCPTIIYVSRTKRAEELAYRLKQDGYKARAFHGRMDAQEKSENQDAFINGNIDIMVATSAFGMGVDKKDVGMVIHYNISDSLENYIQEAGRAGRDQKITAECFILFDEEDLNKHFVLLNQTKITLPEIQQIWKAIKKISKTRERFSNSALEIAREAGWDDSVKGIETRVKTAIAALENAGYIKRGQNIPRVYADSIIVRNVIEAKEKITKSQLFTDKEEEMAVRIITMLISSKYRKYEANELSETRIDYISDILGIKKEEVIRIIQKFREAKILADAKDLTALIDKSGSLIKAMNTLNTYIEIEKFLLEEIPYEKTVINIKKLNELAETNDIKNVNLNKIKKVINFWTIKNIVKKEKVSFSAHHLKINFTKDKDVILKEFTKRIEIAEFIIEYFENKNIQNDNMINFSILELKEAFNTRMQILMKTVTTEEIENAIFYLTKIGALKIEGGFLVFYNSLSIERVVKDNKIRYKLEDYTNLKRFYEQKMQMIHIVGEYARKMMEDYQAALQFVDDYFQLEYSSFLRKYFKGAKKEEIKRNITPEKFKKLFGELSLEQLSIINDKESQYIVVAAGPGSGKTRILVHKLASLLLMEDIKHEQLLMLTFSRLAATEFKKRLIDLIGNSAYFVEIKTFHSFCFDLLGKIGNIDGANNVIEEAVLKIEADEVEISKITKTVLVIDEAQDMDENEYRLIKALIDKNTDLRVIAVGDDDQNIYSFRGSSSKYMQSLLKLVNAKKYELVNNFRSKVNLVEFTNAFVETINNRMKKTPIMSVSNDNGEIKIIQYNSEHFIISAINKLLSEGIKGSTCILTKTNEEALQVAGLLKKNKIRTKLIQANDRIKLYNMIEIRYFLNELNITKDTYKITDEVWDEAKRKLKLKYSYSENYYLWERLIQDFEITYKHKYVSDLRLFIKESKIEDFYDKKEGLTIVSTMHKAKGWEFDNVIMILKDIDINNNENKRLLYVGMTRAKNSLTIHYNGNYFNKKYNYKYGMLKNLSYKMNDSFYKNTNFILVQLSYKDVFLSYFNNTQKYINNLRSGDKLQVDEEGCLDLNNNRVLRFSQGFKEKISKLKQKNYYIKSAQVKYIVYWKESNTDKEILLLLPEIEFIKSSNLIT